MDTSGLSKSACTACIGSLNVAQILLDNIISTAALNNSPVEEVLIKTEPMDDDSVEDEVIEDMDPLTSFHSDRLDMFKEEPVDFNSAASSTAFEEDFLAPSLRSQAAYLTTYKKYSEWKKENQFTSDDESVLLSYFQLLADAFVPSSLWTKYCHLNSVLQNLNGKGLSDYKNLKDFIINANKGYTARIRPFLTSQQVETYLNLNDDQYFFNQVVLVLGFYGDMTSADIYNLQLKDVKDEITKIRVNYSHSTDQKRRTVYISGCGEPVLRRYLNLRAKKYPGPFLYKLKDKEIGPTRLGLKSIKVVCREVAVTLQLDDPMSYTSKSMQRSMSVKKTGHKQ